MSTRPDPEGSDTVKIATRRCSIIKKLHLFPGIDLCYRDAALPLTTAGEELHDLDDNLHVLGVK